MNLSQIFFKKPLMLSEVGNTDKSASGAANGVPYEDFIEWLKKAHYTDGY
ncbi:MAG: hypothetical protein KBC17_02155 [Candidatus Pacebacteria bacterium]|nr:hypothetical protein [Candidatus Paceibacterota bacterium]